MPEIGSEWKSGSPGHSSLDAHHGRSLYDRDFKGGVFLDWISSELIFCFNVELACGEANEGYCDTHKGELMMCEICGSKKIRFVSGGKYVCMDCGYLPS